MNRLISNTKLLMFIVMSLAITVSAQNTSIGHVDGTLKDTNVTYKENPEKHAHVETTPLKTVEKKQGNDNNTAYDRNTDKGQTTSPSNEVTDNVITTTSATTVTESTPAATPANDCACTLAYALGGIGLLGMLIFLFLYLNERKKNEGKH